MLASSATNEHSMAVIAMGTWKKMILKMAPCEASWGKLAIRLISRASSRITAAPRT